jgi:hypothetical protein
MAVAAAVAAAPFSGPMSCFVDPDGFVADRAYDLGVALRDWTGLLLGPDARRTAERLAPFRPSGAGWTRSASGNGDFSRGCSPACT